jgi:hypothetical protein
MPLFPLVSRCSHALIWGKCSPSRGESKSQIKCKLLHPASLLRSRGRKRFCKLKIWYNHRFACSPSWKSSTLLYSKLDNETYLISANSHRPVVDSLNLPASPHISTLCSIDWGKRTRGPLADSRLTCRIQHSLYGTTYTRSLSQDDELESITGDECHIFAEALILARGGHLDYCSGNDLATFFFAGRDLSTNENWG